MQFRVEQLSALKQRCILDAEKRFCCNIFVGSDKFSVAEYSSSLQIADAICSIDNPNGQTAYLNNQFHLYLKNQQSQHSP